MEETVVIKNEKRLSDTALFLVSVLGTVGIGLLISYFSGILNGMSRLTNVPYVFPAWSIIIMPPVLFLHLGIAMYLMLRENIYTDGARVVRAWALTFWSLLFIATAITPYFVFHNMAVASYIVSTIGSALALGTMILMYRHSVGAGVVMTIFFLVSVSVMVYLGYWAF